MATKLEPLHLRITGNASGLSAALGKAQSNVRGFASRVEEQSHQIGNRLKNIATFTLPAGLIAGLGFGVKMAADVQQIEASFKSLTGSAAEADAMIKRLRTLASSTPLQFQGLAKAAQTLLAYGSANDEVADQIRLLGDVSLGNQEKLDRLAVAFGQVQAKGRLMAQEVNQMVENGFNPLVEISRTTGRSMDDLFKAMERGEISFDVVVGAFRSATSEGGRFFEAMENQSQTLTGRLSTLKDNVGLLAAQVGEVLVPAVSAIVEKSIEWVEYLRSIDTEAAEIVAKTIAFTAALAGTALVLPRLIALGKQVAIAIRGIASASAVAQALSGPKGWATLAVGLAAAGVAVASVDSLFATMDSTQQKAAKSAEALADKQSEITKRTIEAGKAASDAAKEQEKWSKVADGFRKSLATPIEQYTSQIEELSNAVRNGGLEWEFFERGVKKALEQLDSATNKSKDLKQPDAVLKGSQEDRESLFQFRNQGNASKDFAGKIADEVDKLKGKLAAEREEAEKLKQNLRESAVAVAETNVDKLTAGLEKAKSDLAELRKQANALRDFSYDDADLTGRLNAAGPKLKGLVSGLFGGDGSSLKQDPNKIAAFKEKQQAAESKAEEALKKQQELMLAQQELENKRKAAADAKRESQLNDQADAINNLADAVRNKPERPPLSL